MLIFVDQLCVDQSHYTLRQIALNIYIYIYIYLLLRLKNNFAFEY